MDNCDPHDQHSNKKITSFQKFFSRFRIRNHPILIRPMEAFSLLQSVDGDSWFGTTQVSLARNSTLIKSRTFVRSQMSVSIFLLIANFMSWGRFSITNADKSDPQLLLSIPRFFKVCTFDSTSS